MGPANAGALDRATERRSRFRVIEGLYDPAPSWQHRQALHRRFLGIGDVLASALAIAIVLALPGGAQLGPVVLAGMPLTVLIFKLAGLYDRDQMRLVRSTLDEVPVILQLSGLYALVVTILAPVLLNGHLRTIEMAGLWVLSFGSIVGGRVIARWAARKVSPVERCLVIGEIDQAQRIREKLASSRSHTHVVATLPLSGHRVDSLGGVDGVRRMVAHVAAHRIIIAPTRTDPNGVAELIRIAKAAGAQVSVLPRMLEAAGSAVEFEDIDGMTMLGLRPFGLSRSSRLIKRGFDIAATTLGLIAVAPILAVLAAAIRIESRGPVFFRQVRVGRDGQHFRIFKFRSMCVDAESQKDTLRGLNEVGDGMFKITEDPRVTRVGEAAPPHLARRAAAAVQRAARRDEPRGPAPAGDRRGRAGPRPRPPAPAPDARHDRPVAGARRPRPDGRDGRDRLPLRRRLVALGRREAPHAHRAARAARRQRLTRARRKARRS